MLADSCEGAARAASTSHPQLSAEQLTRIVEEIFTERIEDGQLDESSLTFSDVATVKASLIETLIGIYHPRIQYPSHEERLTNSRRAAQPAAAADEPADDGDADVGQRTGGSLGTRPR